jgi:Protein of unknown function (DUF3099)
MAADGLNQDGPNQDGPNQDGLDQDAKPPSRRDKRVYLALMTICIGLFVLSWAVLDRYSVTAAIAVSVVALVIPPFAVIIANVGGAADRRRP